MEVKTVGSGGLITYNLREGFRSEYIARFVFSAFGPANPYPQEDDFGLDLICNLAEIDGRIMKIKSAYGVQVKSEGTQFEFKGKDAFRWLNSLEFPMFLADVSKRNFSIKIYTTWNLNRLLPSIDFSNPDAIPDEIHFMPDSEDQLEGPEISTGKIPIGKPILEFGIDELRDKSARDRYWKILKEWIELDYDNYRFRKAGITSQFGYLTWSTNKSKDEEMRTWHKNFHYSPAIHEGIMRLLSEAFIIEGLYCKGSYESTKNESFKERFNSAKDYVDKYLSEHMSDFEEFGKNVFDNKL